MESKLPIPSLPNSMKCPTIVRGCNAYGMIYSNNNTKLTRAKLKMKFEKQ